MAIKKKKAEEKIIKITDMTVSELLTRERELAKDIQKKKLELSIGRLKNTRLIYLLRKDLARVKTVITQKNTVKSASTQKKQT